MGKNSLIGGSIWDEYSQKVQDRMNNPQHMGEFSEEELNNAKESFIFSLNLSLYTLSNISGVIIL